MSYNKNHSLDQDKATQHHRHEDQGEILLEIWNLNRTSGRVQEQDSIDLADMIVFIWSLFSLGGGGVNHT